ncbi:DUF2383 domain-containing protein [Winogradskyella maritima]|uniref:DUF2383 domain-containing protein n=1 Tax=Winogradskyella maritima TaxID=1517766 RepID=A0ABV8AK23_9FLAO|nr:DUF2383 domain-containing protein [Winogradskyella maritima]
MITRNLNLKNAKTLKTLLETAYDIESSYDQLIAQTKNDDLILWIDNKRQIATDLILDILLELNDMEITPMEKGSVAGGLNRLWFDLFSSVTLIKDSFVINKCRKLDRNFVRTIKKFQKSFAIDDNFKETLDKYRVKIYHYNNPNGSEHLMVV